MTFIGEQSELQEILSSFPICPPKRIYPHRSVFRLTDGKRQHILKPLKTGAIRSFLIGELLKKAERCKLIPAVVATKNGRTYLWRKGNRYFLIQFFEGREADYYRTKDLEAAIRSMSMFHSFSKELIRESAKWSLLAFNPERQWQIYLQEMIACRKLAIKCGDSWSRSFLRLWYRFYEQACQAIESFPESGEDDDSLCLCYHDWAYHNLIIEDNLAYLVDFDYMLLDRAVHDKCNLISRYLRLFRWESSYLLKILWYFDRHYPWRKGELRLLWLYLTFPYDFWMLGRQYFIEKLPWSRQYAQMQWDNKIALFQTREKTLEILKLLE